MHTNRVRCLQVTLRYDCQFGLILLEAVQSRLFSPVLLLQEQISGTQAAEQAEPKQAASQVSIKPGPCFKAKTSRGCNNAGLAPSTVWCSGMQLNWCPWLTGAVKYQQQGQARSSDCKRQTYRPHNGSKRASCTIYRQCRQHRHKHWPCVRLLCIQVSTCMAKHLEISMRHPAGNTCHIHSRMLA